MLHIWYTNSASSRFFITMQWFNRFVTGKDGWGCETIQWDYSTWNPEGGRLWYVGWRVQLSRHTEVLGLVYFARLLSSEYQKDFLLYNSSFVIYAAFQALRWVLMCHTYWLCEDNCLAFNRLTCCWIFIYNFVMPCLFVGVFFFREVMETSFLEYYDYYKSVCSSKRHLQGQTMQVCSAVLYLK